MLSVAHMPSDFHPLVLIHADLVGVTELAKILDSLADGKSTEALVGSNEVKTAALVIQVVECEGLFAEVDDALHWYLTKEMAANHASDLIGFVSRNELSGSVILENGILDETPIKVTVGEFDDAFFTDSALQ
ncbi:hypothetical protein ACQKE4_16290 [Halomonas sp. NPDC076908]|uniref:hypothetical protein n=1 Tax=Halomonas sp. NPDC076908 TaxID=3390567 RepID=UPI003CFD6415